MSEPWFMNYNASYALLNEVVVLHNFFQYFSGNNSQENMKGKSTGVQSTNKVDKFAIVFLPIVFLLFNIVYWTSYTF